MMSTSAHAATSLVDSHAGDIYVDLTILDAVSGSVGPFAYAAGESVPAAPDYSASQTFLSAAASGGATTLGAAPSVSGLSLTTKTLTASASGSSSPTLATSTASAEVEGLSLAVNAATVVPLITLDGASSDLKSTSTATSSSAGMMVSGSSSIAGLTLDVLGVDIDLGAYANAAPNTQVILTGLATDLTGLTVTVNKQITDFTADSASITTDALDIDFNNLSLGGAAPISTLASGDIRIAESFAQVPEPAVWAELLLGLAGLGGMLRGRRRLLPAA